jgi:hypothetical protein
MHEPVGQSPLLTVELFLLEGVDELNGRQKANPQYSGSSLNSSRKTRRSLSMSIILSEPAEICTPFRSAALVISLVNSGH